MAEEVKKTPIKKEVKTEVKKTPIKKEVKKTPIKKTPIKKEVKQEIKTEKQSLKQPAFIVDVRKPHVVHIFNKIFLEDKNFKGYDGKVVNGRAVDYK